MSFIIVQEHQKEDVKSWKIYGSKIIVLAVSCLRNHRLQEGDCLKEEYKDLSLRSHWRPQNFNNKLTAALFLKTNEKKTL